MHHLRFNETLNTLQKHGVLTSSLPVQKQATEVLHRDLMVQAIEQHLTNHVEHLIKTTDNPS